MNGPSVHFCSNETANKILLQIIAHFLICVNMQLFSKAYVRNHYDKLLQSNILQVLEHERKETISVFLKCDSSVTILIVTAEETLKLNDTIQRRLQNKHIKLN